MKEAIEKLAHWKTDVMLIGKNLSEDVWITPVKPGKWSIREITGHMLYWDVFLNSEGLPSLLTKQSIVFPDHDKYNAESVTYISGKSKDEILTETVEQRDRLLSQLLSLSEQQWMKPISINGKHTDDSGGPFTLHSLMLEFAGHDRHHVRQMEEMAAVR